MNISFCVYSVPVLLAVTIGLVWIGLVYNRFVGLRQHIRESWAGIDVELKRRHELVPNLVATVGGYARHEHDLLERVVAARSRAIGAADRLDRKSAEEGELGVCLGRLLSLTEAYPDLKADSHFLALQEELVNTEDRLAAARRFYNGNVRSFNTLQHSFPTNIVAGAFGFKSCDFFELVSSIERANPPVDP